MENYINDKRSIAYSTGENDNLILKIITEHFIGNNMEMPYQYKIDYTNGIEINERGAYIFDFDNFFPTTPLGYKCSTLGQLLAYEDRITNFRIYCKGPTTLYVNDLQIFQSNPNIEGERFFENICVNLKRGYNIFKFETEKTPLGFGFTFGNAMPQWEPYLFKSVGENFKGQLGFRFTKPYENSFEENVFSYPKILTVDENKYNPNPNLTYGDSWQGFIYGKAKFYVKEDLKIEFKNGLCKISVDGNPFENFHILNLKKGIHNICVEFQNNSKVNFNSNFLNIVSIVPRVANSSTWIYLGPIENEIKDTKKLLRMNEIYFDNGDKHYWKPLEKNLLLKPCVESELYGRFTYPMGVTLYGILQCGDFLNIERYKDYVINDVNQIAKFHQYALFDKERSSFPSLNQQICWLSELDDCGSFGALMLETLKHKDSIEVKLMGKTIADFIINHQKREADGAFSRGSNTMWIDDMYMCVPFLTRYYELTNEELYIDEAVNQLLLYKKYFFMEDKKIMSHIFDLKNKKANLIPWSRGNGWVIFSLSELLRVLSKSHKDYDLITKFFNEMIEGLLQLQGENGMWHQVLDDFDTYYESSSTAMFICAMSRSIQQQYCIPDKKELILQSIDKAWKGLIYNAIDEKGNLYGVCRGSGCSFSREYYKNLSWRYNDTHGIGIILLAGIEKCKVIH